jgi:epoxide hydrolase-like predicted phosphatase
MEKNMDSRRTTTQRSADPKIKWLLIDIGDVLLLKDRDKNFSILLAEELGVDIELAQQINKVHYTTMDAKYIPEEAFVAELEQNLGYKAPKNIFSYFARAYRQQVRPNTELLTFLDTMRATGIKTAVLSNTIAIYRTVQEQAGISLENGFDPILYSWRVEMLKPNKDIFELAVRELKVQPEEILFIDDKLEHVGGAQQVGMKTLLFDETENVILKIRELCR